MANAADYADYGIVTDITEFLDNRYSRVQAELDRYLMRNPEHEGHPLAIMLQDLLTDELRYDSDIIADDLVPFIIETEEEKERERISAYKAGIVHATAGVAP